MPINVQDGLPAIDTLKSENIFIMTNSRAMSQKIRPLEIALINLMPKKSETETQFVRLLSNTPLQINLDLIHMKTHASKNTTSSHLQRFYYTFDEVREKRYDGLIITGAPVELMRFEEVDYWEELCAILDWAKTHVYSTLSICWGAQAALYHQYGIEKRELSEKVFGVFETDIYLKHNCLFHGFDETFLAPHSRHTEVVSEQIEAHEELEVLASSKECGIFLAWTKKKPNRHRNYYVMGHLEYDKETLKEEYFRDLGREDVKKPQHYFPQENEQQQPQWNWHGAASLFFSNWLNYAVYQNTPFDLKELEDAKREDFNDAWEEER